MQKNSQSIPWPIPPFLVHIPVQQLESPVLHFSKFKHLVARVKTMPSTIPSNQIAERFGSALWLAHKVDTIVTQKSQELGKCSTYMYSVCQFRSPGPLVPKPSVPWSLAPQVHWI